MKKFTDATVPFMLEDDTIVRLPAYCGNFSSEDQILRSPEDWLLARLCGGMPRSERPRHITKEERQEVLLEWKRYQALRQAERDRAERARQRELAEAEYAKPFQALAEKAKAIRTREELETALAGLPDEAGALAKAAWGVEPQVSHPERDARTILFQDGARWASITKWTDHWDFETYRSEEASDLKCLEGHKEALAAFVLALLRSKPLAD